MVPSLIVDFGRGLPPSILSALTAAGILGAFIYVAAFILLQTKRLPVHGTTYSLLNVVGAALVLASLVAEWSTASCISNFIWFVIALSGLRPGRQVQKREEVGKARARFRQRAHHTRKHTRRRRHLLAKSMKFAQ